MQETIFLLIQIAIKGEPLKGLTFSGINWSELLKFASVQGVKGLVWQGIEIQRKAKLLNIEVPIVLKWFANIHFLEQRMQKLYDLSAEYAKSISPYRCVVLKGIDYARYWPNPRYRQYGDLDYYSGNEFYASNEEAKRAGARVKDGGYKHSHINYKGLIIENHQFFTDFNGTKQGIRTEVILKEIIGGEFTPIDDSFLLSPNPTFTALFLLRHAQLHFLAEGVLIRHVLDWLFFLRTEQDNINWNKVLPAMESMRLTAFAQIMTACCEKYFDWKPSNEFVPIMNTGDRLVELFLKDIVNRQPKVYDMRLHKKAFRIFRRSVRMIKFRRLMNESYFSKLCQSLVYNSVTGV